LRGVCQTESDSNRTDNTLLMRLTVPKKAIRSSGYVAGSLEAAPWCVGRTGTFFDVALFATNLGEDADTTAAIIGELADALYGVAGIQRE
jgi:ADP-ribosylglycohydrolase